MSDMNYNIRRDDDGSRKVYVVSDARRVTLARKPRERAIALSDTIVTRADGSQYVIPKTTHKPPNPAQQRKRQLAKEQALVDRQNKLDALRSIRAADLAAIGGQYD